MKRKKYIELTIGQLCLLAIGTLALAALTALWLNGELHMYGIVGN